MTALSVLVAEDELLSRAKLVRLLREDPRFSVVGEAQDGIEAVEAIERLRPDVVVLDVQMPGLNGFEVLDASNERDFVVVFSTAHDEHALRAFESHAVDYLLKPYAARRFRAALDKAFALRTAGAPRFPSAVVKAALPEVRERITLKTADGPWITARTADILRISAANKHTCIVTRGGSHLVRQPLREVAARLPSSFVRDHRSEVVNVDAVRRVEPWAHGDALVVLEDDSSVVLTRTFRKNFLERYTRTRAE